MMVIIEHIFKLYNMIVAPSRKKKYYESDFNIMHDA